MNMDSKQPENPNNTAPESQPSPDESAAVVAQCGGKLHCYDWLSDIPESHDDTEMVEVQFKNTRKGYYKNSVHLRLEKGDIVAVEGNPGHDIGVVTLTGRLVLLQMRKNGVKLDNPDLKRVYRKAKPNDLEKYREAKAREHSTMVAGPQDSRRPPPEHENRRCRVSGRRQQGHLLLHRRRPGRLPATHQGAGPKSSACVSR